MFNKKAISPLIATVLIIGFTIVLAALVIQWGGQLVEKMKAETEMTSELSLICSTGLTELKITKVAPNIAATPPQFDVTIDNKNDQAIESMVFRLYTEVEVSQGDITAMTDKSMTEFQVKTYNIGVPAGTTVQADPPKIGDFTKIGALPVVKLSDGTKKTCSKELTYPV